MRTVVPIRAALVVTMLALGVRAQGLVQPLPQFEVATIKPATAWRPTVTFPGAGRFSVGGETLAGLIAYAYDAGLGSNKEISGGPAWIYRDFYSVEAVAQGSPTIAGFQAMLRTLLEERFALKVRSVSKPIDVYAMQLAREDRQVGPNLRPFPGECGVLRPILRGAAKQGPTKQGVPKQDTEKQPADRPYLPDPAPETPPHGCLVFFGGQNGILLEGAPLAFLARLLSTQATILGRPVLDRTGLPGRFNIRVDIEFPPRPNQNAGARQADVFAPLLFTALEKQLGVKLEASKGSVENIVVEAAARPTEN